MKKFVMKKWVKSLRSGEYIQGTGQLHDAVRDEYCCLGVLREIAPKKVKAKDTDTEVASYEVQEWSGLHSSQGELASYHRVGLQAFNSLTAINDGGATFHEIADIIEKHYEAL